MLHDPNRKLSENSQREANFPSSELFARTKAAAADYTRVVKASEQAQREFIATMDERDACTHRLAGLLLEAKAHVRSSFEQFCAQHFGLQKSRVWELLQIGRGDKSIEQKKQETRERVQRFRDKAKSSVTPDDVTEAAERARAEQQAKAKAQADAAKARAKARADAKRDAHFRRMTSAILKGPDRDTLVKALGMMGSEHDGEALNAARKAEQLRRKLGVTWEQLVIEASEIEESAAA